jgi:hypothetical protein
MAPIVCQLLAEHCVRHCRFILCVRDLSCHVAGWISLFTLHVIWPFLWIWATLYREDRGWGFSQARDTGATGDSIDVSDQLTNILARLEHLEVQLQQHNESIDEETE